MIMLQKRRPGFRPLTAVAEMHAGACGALLRYIQEEEHVMLAAGSLVVGAVGLQHHMLIDPGTVQTLELIKQRPGRPPLNAKDGTLFRWLNRTKTLPGARWAPQSSRPTTFPQSGLNESLAVLQVRP